MSRNTRSHGKVDIDTSIYLPHNWFKRRSNANDVTNQASTSNSEQTNLSSGGTTAEIGDNSLAGSILNLELNSSANSTSSKRSLDSQINEAIRKYILEGTISASKTDSNSERKAEFRRKQAENRKQKLKMPDEETSFASNEQIMRTFPETNGQDQDFENYLAIGNMLDEMTDDNEKAALAKLAKLRLRGEALQSVLGKTYQNWEELRKHLEKKFLRVPRYLPAFTELAGMTQNRNESIREFADRMTISIRKVNQAITFNRGDENIPLQKEQIQQIAASTFVTGLRSAMIKLSLVDKKIENFEEVVEAAIGKETVVQRNPGNEHDNYRRRENERNTNNRYDDRNTNNMRYDCDEGNVERDGYEGRIMRDRNSGENQRKHVECFYCGKIGHIARDCYRRLNEIGHAGSGNYNNNDRNDRRNESMNHIDFSYQSQNNKDHIPNYNRRAQNDRPTFNEQRPISYNNRNGDHGSHNNNNGNVRDENIANVGDRSYGAQNNYRRNSGN